MHKGAPIRMRKDRGGRGVLLSSLAWRNMRYTGCAWLERRTSSFFKSDEGAITCCDTRLLREARDSLKVGGHANVDPECKSL